MAWNASDSPSGTDFADELKKTDFDFQFWPKFSIAINVDQIRTTFETATNHSAFQRGITSAQVLTVIVPTQFGPYLTEDLIMQFDRFFDTR